MTKRVLITGAASGLGWELTKQYEEQGWHVILLDRDAEALAARSEQITGSHETCFADLTDQVQLTAAIGDLKTEPLDLLINNAGITHRSQASLTDTEVFQRLMMVNWFAPVSLTQQLLPALQSAAGNVVCISSMAAKMPVPGRAAYCASKSALAQHFETWRPELLGRGIGLLLVYPSFMHTSIEANALGSDGQKTERPRTVAGKIHSPESMARRIVKAERSGQQRLYTPQLASRFASWMWMHAPPLFQKMMWRQFAEELETENSPEQEYEDKKRKTEKGHQEHRQGC